MTATLRPCYSVAVTGDMMGNFRINLVVVQDVPWDQMASMRAHGQLDCGKRQAIRPLLVTQLNQAAQDKLFEANLVNEDTDALIWDGPGPDASQDAHQAASIITSQDPRFQVIQVDRTIPCL